MSDGVVDVGALFASLDAKRQAEGLSWRSLAQMLQVAPSTFTRMAQGRRPDVDTFAALLQWLEMPVSAFMHGRQPNQEEQVDPVAKIGTYLRMDRNLTPKAAEALQELIKVAYENLRTRSYKS